MMAVVGWLLGLKMYRFWDDWGLPATTLWLALELQKQFENYLPFDSGRRLLLSTGLGLASSWPRPATSTVATPGTSPTNTLHRRIPSWPAGCRKRGILYNADMVFSSRPSSKTQPLHGDTSWASSLPSCSRRSSGLPENPMNYGDQRAYEPCSGKCNRRIGCSCTDPRSLEARRQHS